MVGGVANESLSCIYAKRAGSMLKQSNEIN